MSKKKPKVKFGRFTLWDLNPDNFSIKNDFMENLVYIASVSCPLLEYVEQEIKKIDMEDVPVSMVLGYKSLASFPEASYWEKFHCSGSALLFTWDGFNREYAKKLIVNSGYLESFEDDFITVVINDTGIRFVSNGKCKLIEIVDGNERTVLSREAER